MSSAEKPSSNIQGITITSVHVVIYNLKYVTQTDNDAFT